MTKKLISLFAVAMFLGTGLPALAQTPDRTCDANDRNRSGHRCYEKNITAEIALKNGSTIKLNSDEKLKVVVYSKNNFNAKKIMANSAKFEGAKAETIKVKDENKDGREDVILTFKVSEMKNLSKYDRVGEFSAKGEYNQKVKGQTSITVVEGDRERCDRNCDNHGQNNRCDKNEKCDWRKNGQNECNYRHDGNYGHTDDCKSYAHR